MPLSIGSLPNLQSSPYRPIKWLLQARFAFFSERQTPVSIPHSLLANVVAEPTAIYHFTRIFDWLYARPVGGDTPGRPPPHGTRTRLAYTCPGTWSQRPDQKRYLYSTKDTALDVLLLYATAHRLSRPPRHLPVM